MGSRAEHLKGKGVSTNAPWGWFLPQDALRPAHQHPTPMAWESPLVAPLPSPWTLASVRPSGWSWGSSCLLHPPPKPLPCSPGPSSWSHPPWHPVSWLPEPAASPALPPPVSFGLRSLVLLPKNQERWCVCVCIEDGVCIRMVFVCVCGRWCVCIRMVCVYKDGVCVYKDGVCVLRVCVFKDGVYVC